MISREVQKAGLFLGLPDLRPDLVAVLRRRLSPRPGLVARLDPREARRGWCSRARVLVRGPDAVPEVPGEPARRRRSGDDRIPPRDVPRDAWRCPWSARAAVGWPEARRGLAIAFLAALGAVHLLCRAHGRDRRASRPRVSFRVLSWWAWRCSGPCSASRLVPRSSPGRARRLRPRPRWPDPFERWAALQASSTDASNRLDEATTSRSGSASPTTTRGGAREAGPGRARARPRARPRGSSLLEVGAGTVPSPSRSPRGPLASPRSTTHRPCWACCDQCSSERRDRAEPLGGREVEPHDVVLAANALYRAATCAVPSTRCCARRATRGIVVWRSAARTRRNTWCGGVHPGVSARAGLRAPGRRPVRPGRVRARRDRGDRRHTTPGIRRRSYRGLLSWEPITDDEDAASDRALAKAAAARRDGRIWRRRGRIAIVWWDKGVSSAQPAQPGHPRRRQDRQRARARATCSCAPPAAAAAHRARLRARAGRPLRPRVGAPQVAQPRPPDHRRLPRPVRAGQRDDAHLRRPHA